MVELAAEEKEEPAHEPVQREVEPLAKELLMEHVLGGGASSLGNLRAMFVGIDFSATSCLSSSVQTADRNHFPWSH